MLLFSKKFALVLMLVLCGCSSVKVTQEKHFSVATKKKNHQVEETNYHKGKYYNYLMAQQYRRSGTLTHAIQSLKKAIAFDATSVFLKRELARCYIDQNENEMALQTIEAAIRTNPNDIETIIYYARILESMDRMEDAKKAYYDIIAIDPKQEEILLRLGHYHMEAKEYSAAQKIYTMLIEHFPHSYVGQFFLGKIYAIQGEFEMAEAKFKKTLTLAPGLEEPKIELIAIYKEQGEKEKIISLYQDILKTNSDNIHMAFELALFYAQENMLKDAVRLLEQLGERSLHDRAVVRAIVQKYIEKKRYDDAIILLKGMLQGAPENDELLYVAGVAHDEKGEKQRAVEFFEKVDPDSQFHVSAVIQTALIYQEKGDVETAISLISSLIDKIPDNPDFYLYLGSFYEQIEDTDRAIEAFQKGLGFNSQHIGILFRVGVVYDKIGDKDASIEQMKKIIAIDPHHTNALNYLGYTYADMGINLDEAERLITAALKNRPDDGYITDSLGWVYYQKGQIEKALVFLKKAVALMPEDPIILEHLGDAYLALGKTENALQYYKKALSLKGDDTAQLEKKIKSLITKGNK